MAETNRSEARDATNFLTGQLLIAMPMMEDPRFAQSVIYLCAHTPEGAMGLVLNRPLQRPKFDELLRQLEVAPVPPARRIRLCAGGPMDNARGFVLHTTDWTGEGSLRVNDFLALTASLDVLKAIAEGRGPREGRSGLHRHVGDRPSALRPQALHSQSPARRPNSRFGNDRRPWNRPYVGARGDRVRDRAGK